MAEPRHCAELKSLLAHVVGGAKRDEGGVDAAPPRYWLRITGLPGWRRRELGLPSFGRSLCSRQLR